MKRFVTLLLLLAFLSLPIVAFAETNENFQDAENILFENSSDEKKEQNEKGNNTIELINENETGEEKIHETDSGGKINSEQNNIEQINDEQPANNELKEEVQPVVEDNEIQDGQLNKEETSNLEEISNMDEFDGNQEEQIKVGWHQEDGKIFFYDKYGNREAGIIYIEGNYYYFDYEKGLQKGWIKEEYEDEDGSKWVIWYYADENGVLSVNKWSKIGGKWYYFNEYGEMETGITEINGKLYYLDDSGAMRIGWIKETNENEYSTNTTWYYANSDGSLKISEWFYDGNDWYYFDYYGEMLSGGTFYILENDEWYFFDSSGRLGKGGWSRVGNKWYYTNRDGTPVYGWKFIGGSWYFFDGDGLMQTGLIYDYYHDLYFLDKETGKMISGGWIHDKEWDEWYYADKSGKLRSNSWLYQNGNWYYFHEYGYMVTGSYKIGNNVYLFDSSGKMIKQKGWYEDWYGNLYYNNGDGTVKVGWVIIGHNSYYFDEYNGILIKTVENEKPEIKAGWSKENNIWYYYDASGNKLRGYQVIDGTSYFFDVYTGAMKTGWIYYRYEDEDGYYTAWYYGEPSGALKRSSWLKDNGKWYYFWQDGTMAIYYAYINGNEYFFDADGSMKTGWIKIKYDDVELWHYADSNGVLRKNNWLNYSGDWYYFDYEGYMVANETYYIDDKYYFFDEDGKLAKGGWYSDGYYRYYTNKDGTVLTGWQKIDGKWYYFGIWGDSYKGWSYVGDDVYYFDEETGEMLTGWIHEKGEYYETWYYADSSGKLYRSQWLKYGNNWYYFDHWGNMYTWPLKIGGKLYLFKDSGELLVYKGGWVQGEFGDWYYSDGDGSFKFGWWRINGEWYYFDEDFGFLWY